MVRKVLKVNCCGFLLKKFGALYPNLGVIFDIFTRCIDTGGYASPLQLVDAVALARFILLRQNDLLKADHLILRLVEELLVVVGHVTVRYFGRTKALLDQYLLLSTTTIIFCC